MGLSCYSKFEENNLYDDCNNHFKISPFFLFHLINDDDTNTRKSKLNSKKH
jgi:hypothetical protein